MSKSNKNNYGIFIVVILVILVVAGFLWWNYGQNKNDEEVKTFVHSRYNNIDIESDIIYEGDYVYSIHKPVTENETINTTIDAFVDGEVESFLKNIANHGGDTVAEDGTFKNELNISQLIDHANDESISVVFTVRHFTHKSNESDEKSRSFLFDRTNGEQIKIGDLFSTDNYAALLADASGLEEDATLFETFLFSENDTLHFYSEGLEIGSVDALKLEDDLNIDTIRRIDSSFADKVQADENGRKRIADEKEKKRADAETQKVAQHAQIQKAIKNNKSDASIDCNVKKCAALTFDDGPHTSNTPELLGYLDEYGAKATFFMIGQQVPANADIVRQVVEAGHDVGNHTWSHPQLTKISTQTVKQQINDTNDAIENVIGETPFLMRPPYGAINNSVMSGSNMAFIEWSVDPQDWKNRDSDIVFQRVTSTTDQDDIVLSHDIHPTTVKAYPRILEKLTAEGFTFVTVSQLLGIEKNNHDQFVGQNYNSGK